MDRTATALEIKLPEKMTCTVYHKFDFDVPPKDTVMAGYIFQKDNAFFGFQHWYGMNQMTSEVGDTVKIAPLDLEKRIAQTTSVKPFYQIDSFLPGSRCRFTVITYRGDNQLHGLKVTLKLDFPPDADLEEEQKQLERQCAEKYQEYITSHKELEEKIN